MNISRAAWSYCKKHTGIDSNFLGYIDFLFLLAYAIGMFFAGMIGDKINVRYFYSFALFATALCYISTGLLGIL